MCAQVENLSPSLNILDRKKSDGLRFKFYGAKFLRGQHERDCGRRAGIEGGRHVVP